MEYFNSAFHNIGVCEYHKSESTKRIEVGVSIYKVGGELSAGGTNRAPQAQVGESPRGVFPPSLVGGGYGGSPPENV